MTEGTNDPEHSIGKSEPPRSPDFAQMTPEQLEALERQAREAGQLPPREVIEADRLEGIREMMEQEQRRERVRKSLKATSKLDDDEIEAYLDVNEPSLTPDGFTKQFQALVNEVMEVEEEVDRMKLQQIINALIQEGKTPPDQIPAKAQAYLEEQKARQSMYGPYSALYELAHQEYKQARKVGDKPKFELLRQKFIEDRLQGMEEDDTDPSGGDIQQLMGLINQIFSGELRRYRADFITAIEARMTLHITTYMAKYIGAAKWQESVTNFLPRHLQTLKAYAGVRRGLKILEEADKNGAKGEYYRDPEVDKEEFEQRTEDFYVELRKQLEQELEDIKDPRLQEEKKKDYRKYAWIADKKFKLIEEARKATEDEKQAKAKLDEAEAGTDEQAKKQAKKDYDKAIKEQESLNFLNFKDEPKLKKEGFESEKYDLLFKMALKGLEETDNLQKPKTPIVVIEELTKKYPDLAKQWGFIDGAGKVNTKRHVEFEQCLFQIHRAFYLSEKIHHSFAMSAVFDGLVWRKYKVDKNGYEVLDQAGHKILEELPAEIKALNIDSDDPKLRRMNVAGGAVIFNPIVPKWEWEDPFTKEKKTTYNINLDIAADIGFDDSDPARLEMRGAFLDIQKRRPHLIGQIRARAIEQFCIKYSDQLDFKKSIGGKGARELKKLHNKVADFNKETEANNGKFARLRRRGYLHTLSISDSMGRSTAEEVMDNWGKDFQKIKPTVKRWAGANELKDFYIKAGPRLMYEARSVQDAAGIVKTLMAFKEKAGYMTEHSDESEVEEFIKSLAEGILELRTTKYNEITELAKMDDLLVYNTINQIRAVDLIHDKDYFDMRKEFLHQSPFWLEFRMLRESTNPGGALLAMLLRLFKEFFVFKY